MRLPEPVSDTWTVQVTAICLAQTVVNLDAFAELCVPCSEQERWKDILPHLPYNTQEFVNCLFKPSYQSQKQVNV